MQRSPASRAPDFGYIQVGLSRHDDDDDNDDDDYDSLYASPTDKDFEKEDIAIHFPPRPRDSFSPTDLQLHLDDPSKLYAPQDTVTGYISGWNQSARNPTHVHVILEGRAKTCLRGDLCDTEYVDQSPLLYQVTHLKPDQYGMVPRFAVTIPDTTADDLEQLDDYVPKDYNFEKYWTHDWPGHDPFECQPGHALPPSMAMVPRSSISLSARGSGRGYIEYKIIAVRSSLNPTTGRLVPEASCQVPIRITSRRLPLSKVRELMGQPSTATAALTVQTAQLSKDRRLSLCEQLRDAFSSSAPNFYFSNTVTTPKLSVPGADVKVILSLHVLPPPPGKLYNFPVPDIAVTCLKFRLRSHTGVRVLRAPDLSSPDKPAQMKAHTFKATELRTSRSPPGAAFKPRQGNFNRQSCIVTLRLPHTLVPSFRTYNFWRSYRLECDVTFTVAGKEVTSRTQSDLNVVARPEGAVETKVDLARSEMEREDEADSLEVAQTMVAVAGVEVDKS